MVSKKNEKSELNKLVKLRGYHHKSPWEFPLKFSLIPVGLFQMPSEFQKNFQSKTSYQFRCGQKKEMKKIELNKFVKFRGYQHKSPGDILFEVFPFPNEILQTFQSENQQTSPNINFDVVSKKM